LFEDGRASLLVFAVGHESLRPEIVERQEPIRNIVPRRTGARRFVFDLVDIFIRIRCPPNSKATDRG
jgi:hypothetical protein